MSTAALGDIAEFINGAAFKPEDWGGEGMRIIRIQNLNDPTKPYNRTKRKVAEKYLVPQGTLLVSWSASLGVFEWNESDTALLNQHIFKVVPDLERVRKDYLKIMLVNALTQMAKFAHGSTMQHVNRGEFLDTRIPLPCLAEQKRISEILSQADELRRKRQRALDRLNQLGQAIFVEMFGDLSGGGIDLEPLGSLTSKIGSGATPKGGDSAYKPEGIPLIRSMNVRDGHFLPKGLAYIDEAQAAKLNNVIVRGGDVLLNITGASVARVCIAPASMDGARVNQHVSIIRPTKRLLSVFIEAYLLLPIVKKKLLQIADSGATRQAITKSQIEQLVIPVPPIHQQEVFAEKIAIVQQVQDSASMQRATLEDLFASLQHRSFEGEL